jgi:hypothetical protein
MQTDDLVMSILGNGDATGMALLTKHINIAASIFRREKQDDQDALSTLQTLVSPPPGNIHNEWYATERRLTWLTLCCTSTGYRTLVERKSGIGAPRLWDYLTAVFDGYTMGLDTTGTLTTDPTQVRFKNAFEVVDALRLWYARLG